MYSNWPQSKSVNLMTANSEDQFLKFKLIIGMQKKGDLSYFESCLIIDVRPAGREQLGSADVLCLQRKGEMISEWRFLDKKYAVDVRGEWADWLQLHNIHLLNLNRAKLQMLHQKLVFVLQFKKL